MTEPLSVKDVDAQLDKLNRQLAEPWVRVGNALHKTFRFTDFREAFAFMTRVAGMAEQMDHHPDWSNVWNRVDVRLSTHDAGGITERDFRLAFAMEGVVSTG